MRFGSIDFSDLFLIKEISMYMGNNLKYFLVNAFNVHV